MEVASSATFLTVPQVEGVATVAAVAKSCNVDVANLWLPCVTKAPKPRMAIAIEATASVALFEHDTKRVTLSREAILLKLGLSLPPASIAVPEVLLHRFRDRFTLYVRPEHVGRRRVESGTTLLVLALSESDAIAQGSAFPSGSVPVPLVPSKAGTSRAATATSAVTGGTNLSLALSNRIEGEQAVDALCASMREDQLCAKKRGRSGETAPLKLTEEGYENDAPLLSSSSATVQKVPKAEDEDEEEALRLRGELLLSKVHENLKLVREAPPLHAVQILSGNFKTNVVFRVGSTFQLDGHTWARPDPCVLTYQHVPEANQSAGAIGRLFAPQRMLAVLPLMKLVGASVAPGDDLLELGLTLADERIPERLQQLVERGFKLVLIEQFPQLHHGNGVVMQTTTNAIVNFVQKYLPQVPVQVLLATVSHYSAASSGAGLQYPRFLFPRAGLFSVYLYHCNGQIEPDVDRSFFCGTAGEPDDSLHMCGLPKQDQQLFAKHCGRNGLTFVPAEVLLNQVETLLT